MIVLAIGYEIQGTSPAGWIWGFLFVVTLVFAVRYFAFIAFTGLGETYGEMVWLATFVLIFVKAMRRYVERGAAPVRRPAVPAAESHR